MKAYGIIMAGGAGNRFWPLSTKNCPKQFLNLSGKDTLLNETITRLARVIPGEDIFVVTHISQKEKTLETTRGLLDSSHILLEPAARNTAACIGYAAIEMIRRYGEGIMCILPADHVIKNNEAFAATLEQAIEMAGNSDKLVTIGIKQAYPSTGYGYIKRGENNIVQEFIEKPDIQTAEFYLKSGDYDWNAGMFVWKASVILNYFKKLLPDIADCLRQIEESFGTSYEQETVNRIYPDIPKISIDYGIMERAARDPQGVVAIPGDFGWSDVGSFENLDSLLEKDEYGNVVYGAQLNLDTRNVISYATGRLIATLGVEDLVIAETDKAVLVCHKDRAQEIRLLVEELHRREMMEFL